MAEANVAIAAPRARGWAISVAGAIIMAMSAGAALLPATDQIGGAMMVGMLLLAAGIVELAAGTMRRGARFHAMLAGLVTASAGIVFLLNRVEHFFGTIYIVAAWLCARGIILLLSTVHSDGAVRTWTAASGITDLALSVLLIEGIPIASLVFALFGPTPPLVATFAWVLAASFVVTGLLLLEIGSCERRSDEPV